MQQDEKRNEKDEGASPYDSLTNGLSATIVRTYVPVFLVVIIRGLPKARNAVGARDGWIDEPKTHGQGRCENSAFADLKSCGWQYVYGKASVS